MDLTKILYDVTSKIKYKRWLNYIEQISSHDLVIIVVANKIDKLEEKKFFMIK